MLDPEQTLTTPHLRLEALVEAHADELFGYLQDARLYEFYAGEPPVSVGALRQQYAQWRTRSSPDGRQTWLNYAVRRADGVFVGWVQATVENDVATIGYDIFPQFWRRGYATEACRALVRMLCAAHMQTIRAVVDSENVASIRLLARLGFRCMHREPSDDLPGRQDVHYERRCKPRGER